VKNKAGINLANAGQNNCLEHGRTPQLILPEYEMLRKERFYGLKPNSCNLDPYLI
jgi:hypothetical protein